MHIYVYHIGGPDAEDGSQVCEATVHLWWRVPGLKRDLEIDLVRNKKDVLTLAPTNTAPLVAGKKKMQPRFWEDSGARSSLVCVCVRVCVCVCVHIL